MTLFRSPQGDLSSKRVIGAVVLAYGMALQVCELLWPQLGPTQATVWAGIGAGMIGTGALDRLGSRNVQNINQ